MKRVISALLALLLSFGILLGRASAAQAASSQLAGVFFQPQRGLGVLYNAAEGFVYVPNELNEDTALVVYYPGHTHEGEVPLQINAMIDYVADYVPNAVCYFSQYCDFRAIPEKNERTRAQMAQLMEELSLVPSGVYLAAASNGFYTALDLAMQLLNEDGIGVRAILSCDTGEDWGETDLLLSTEEYAQLAEAATRMELFEQRQFDTSRDVIQDMLQAGLTVDLIECGSGNHDWITEYCLRLGTISWMLGECELHETAFTLIPLNG